MNKSVIVPMNLSIEDRATVWPGEIPHDALMHSIAVAQHVEALIFKRIRVARHHGAGSIAEKAAGKTMMMDHETGLQFYRLPARIWTS